jgi:hypothetical protein
MRPQVLHNLVRLDPTATRSAASFREAALTTEAALASSAQRLGFICSTRVSFQSHLRAGSHRTLATARAAQARTSRSSGSPM